MLFAGLLVLVTCQRHRTTEQLMQSAKRILELRSARESAAVAANAAMARQASTNEDIGDFDSADCHCYPCEASPKDLEAMDMPGIREEMEEQQAQLLKMSATAKDAANKAAERAKKGKSSGRGGSDTGMDYTGDEGFGDDGFGDDDAGDDIDFDENAMRPMMRRSRQHGRRYGTF